MKPIILLASLVLAGCVNTNTATPPLNTASPEKGAWVNRYGHGNKEKIILKNHDGTEKVIDARGLVSNPRFIDNGRKVVYLKGIWRTDGLLAITELDSGKTETYPLETGYRSSIGWSAPAQLLFFNDGASFGMFNTETKSLRYWLKYGSPDSFSTSPDGKYLLFMSRKGRHANAIDGWALYLYDVKNTTARQMGTLNDFQGNFGEFYWSPDSQRFLVNTHFLDKNDPEVVIKTEARWFTLDFKPLNEPTEDDLIYHPQHYPPVISLRHARQDKLD